MSSSYVRDGIISFLNTLGPGLTPAHKVLDLTAEFQELRDMLAAAGVADQQPWLGVQFIGAQEVPVDIRATNSRGKYRESGIIYLHVVDIAKLGVHTLILNRAEAIRNAFRGQRIADTIVIESVSPANFGEGISLRFEGGYTAALIQIDYQRDLDL